MKNEKHLSDAFCGPSNRIFYHTGPAPAGPAARLRQAAVVENIGGGSGRLGAQAVAPAAPDGYTVLLADGTFAATEALPLPGSPALRNALAPLTLAIAAPQGFFTHPRSGLATIEALAAAARARPGALNAGITGIGTSQHFVSELLPRATGDRRVEHCRIAAAGRCCRTSPPARSVSASSPSPPRSPARAIVATG